ncbi:hypothetical protein W97_04936 [Coniosporium apollinis CBS 100218]|uniref:AB hydrolase-1 domain-containing protein n=1 Tax=Coniosporium apollinis (strain CBS 100218) TaxID=1168221 RepID=R7YUW4_CONA1|nr:uncharacterized protein W97_04936 [Coniosporium apollinis CBS 100218]EON65697.1 hypothetical protein W97_04936 [Coniosporium apollinis CBS 100218]
MRYLLQLLTLVLSQTLTASSQSPPHNGTFTPFPYPWPVLYYNFTSQLQNHSMAYMDVSPSPTHSNDQTVVLLHGKNFCAATWEATARVLLSAGYRVVIPDQLGFCRSTKPYNYQFSLHQLALNTHDLLLHLGIDTAIVMGHSMGGMLGVRFALMYPATTARLVLANPIGLEDWKALGVPYTPIDVTYRQELASNFSNLKAYQQTTYYANTWRSAYDVWVQMLADVYAGPEGEAFSWNGARVTDMVFTQPVVYEFPLLTMPTLLLIGMKDTTAVGRAAAPMEIRSLLGRYDLLGKQAASVIPRAALVEFGDLGHAPQIQDPERFHEALMGWLG